MYHNTAVYNVFKPSKLVAELPYLAAFNLVLVACSYISVNLPFSPVPITGQTFGILLIAMILGKTRAVAVVGAYLMEGAAGLPVFAGGTAGIAKFMGPTGGYLIGFLTAAYLVGFLADRGWDKSYFKSVVSMVSGTALIFVTGLIRLSVFVPSENLLQMGLYPFIPGAVIKIGLASAVLPSVWRLVRKNQS